LLWCQGRPQQKFALCARISRCFTFRSKAPSRSEPFGYIACTWHPCCASPLRSRWGSRAARRSCRPRTVSGSTTRSTRPIPATPRSADATRGNVLPDDVVRLADTLAARVKAVAFDMDQCMVAQHSMGRLSKEELPGYLAKVSPDFVALVPELHARGVHVSVGRSRRIQRPQRPTTAKLPPLSWPSLAQGAAADVPLPPPQRAARRRDALRPRRVLVHGASAHGALAHVRPARAAEHAAGPAAPGPPRDPRPRRRPRGSGAPPHPLPPHALPPVARRARPRGPVRAPRAAAHPARPRPWGARRGPATPHALPPLSRLPPPAPSPRAHSIRRTGGRVVFPPPERPGLPS